MKVIKYIIYTLISIIFVCLTVLIITPDQSKRLRLESPIAPVISNSTTLVQPEPNEELNVMGPDNIQSSFTLEQLASMPAFLQSLPNPPSEIDSNGNQIRDDIEVYISFKFPYQPEKRAVYIQMVNIIDKIAKERGKGRTSKQYSIFNEERNTINCWRDKGLTEEELILFKAMILNNNYRKEAYAATLEVWKNLDKEVLNSLKISDKPCNTMLKEYQTALQEWTPN